MCSAGWAQKKKGEEQTRTVEGTVAGPDGEPAVGAEVQLKNTKSLEIHSYISQEGGKFSFHGLSPDVDYELKAQFQGAWSGVKTISSFDSHRQVTVKLKIKK